MTPCAVGTVSVSAQKQPPETGPQNCLSGVTIAQPLRGSFTLLGSTAPRNAHEQGTESEAARSPLV